MAMIDKVNHLWFPLFILISIFTISGAADPDCVYTVYVKTASVPGAGTNSSITLTLYNASGSSIRINNLKTWGGLMGSGQKYFEPGNLDIFGGRRPCLTVPVCAMNLTSDGKGTLPGWYVRFVEVTTTEFRKACTKEVFAVEQWLATDTWPYSLTAFRDYCSGAVGSDDVSGSSSCVAEM